MKRTPALQDLSREHHDALKLARDGRQAALSGNEGMIAASAARVVRTFLAEMEPHFREEETVLLPFLNRCGETDLVWQTLLEHAELRSLVAALQTPNAATLLRFATLLTDHVRFEERTLFEAAQTLDFGTESETKSELIAAAAPRCATPARQAAPALHH